MDDLIHILGIRSFYLKNDDGSYKTDKSGERISKKYEAFYKCKYRANNLQELFNNVDKYVAKIPDNEQWNMYYTVANCKEEKGRKLSTQWYIPFDLDDINHDRIEDYIKIVCALLEVPRKHMAIIMTGNGLQFVVKISKPITNVSFFDENRELYKAICGKINLELFNRGLEGGMDTSVFSPARLLRLPNTINKKPNKPERKAYIIEGNLHSIAFDFYKLSGIPQVLHEDQIHPRAFARLPLPDTKSVLEGCDFLKYCRDSQDDIAEPQWYAMLSIVGRLDNGEQLVHEYSEGHPSYNFELTEEKAQQALTASGPRTCGNIATLWDGCEKCPNNNLCKSPIMIKGENYLKTKDNGFWNVTISKDGAVKRTTPNFDELLAYYDQTHEHITLADTGLVYIFNGQHWEMQEKAQIHNWLENTLNPAPNNKHCQEFEAKVKRTNIRFSQWLNVDGKINLGNGVYSVDNQSFGPHNSDYGFPYVLPYEYIENAECPSWEKFIREVTLDRQELVNVLQEFVGYCLSYLDPSYGEKSLILLGDGSNGKSVFLRILKGLIGRNNYSVMNIAEAVQKDELRTQLINKMANITEETPKKALVESTMFKDLVTGGEVTVRKLYHGSFMVKNYAKFVMACNDMPYINDFSEGSKRRLLILPFDYRVTKTIRNVNIEKELLKELPGIFNWAMAGLRRLKNNSYQFTDSTIIQEQIDDLMFESNICLQFIEERCHIDEAITGTFTKELYGEFMMYAKENGSWQVSRREFTASMSRYLSDKSGKKVKSKTLRLGGATGKGLPFIGIKNDEQTAY